MTIFVPEALAAAKPSTLRMRGPARESGDLRAVTPPPQLLRGWKTCGPARVDAGAFRGAIKPESPKGMGVVLERPVAIVFALDADTDRPFRGLSQPQMGCSLSAAFGPA